MQELEKETSVLAAASYKQMVLTRRHAILLGLGLPIAASANPAREFWNEKKPDEWTEDEVQELLTKSPWAKEASVSYYGGPALGATRGSSSSTGVSRSNGRMTRTSTGSAPSGDVANAKYQAIARWQSALPIREALAKNPKSKLADQIADQIKDHYTIALTGDVPSISDASTDDDDQHQTRLEMLKQYTKLDRKGDPIGIADFGPLGKEGTLFYFPRIAPITAKDGTVTFITKLGPVEVKCKFAVKEMIYQGKLEL